MAMTPSVSSAFGTVVSPTFSIELERRRTGFDPVHTCRTTASTIRRWPFNDIPRASNETALAQAPTVLRWEG
jgi:hypothetical protein